MCAHPLHRAVLLAGMDGRHDENELDAEFLGPPGSDVGGTSPGREPEPLAEACLESLGPDAEALAPGGASTDTRLSWGGRLATMGLLCVGACDPTDPGACGKRRREEGACGDAEDGPEESDAGGHG